MSGRRSTIIGLTPRRFQSGEKDNPGRISHASDADMRSTLYAAANAMLMRSIAWSSLKAWGVLLMKTKGRRRAIVAIARKIAFVPFADLPDWQTLAS